MNDTSTLKKIWLIGFCVLVLIMISVGGITRLTRSGLSIVEWRPITGIIPPLTDQDWQREFQLYQASPEFNQVNSHFSIQEYKNIFLWEYTHRLLGRIIFLFVLIPGFYLWRKKLVHAKLVIQLATLVALQGLIGWLMVKTGLNLKPHVSPYMLALHFFSALSVLIFAYYHLYKINSFTIIKLNSVQIRAIQSLGLIIGIQIFYGCLTSGFKAGYAYNTYPMMNGDFFPSDGLFFHPTWINFFENTSTIQWVHRWLGISILIILLTTTVILKKSSSWPILKKPFFYLLFTALLQVTLGILNILYSIPIALATLHQLCACLFILIYFRLMFRVSN